MNYTKTGFSKKYLALILAISIFLTCIVTSVASIAAKADPAPLQGDVNGDGKVDMDDLTAVRNQIFGTDGPFDKADITADGIVNVFDVMAIKGLITDEDDYEIPATFDNPIIRTDADGNTFFSADPSVRVFNGKLYMYPSHDVFPANRCNNMDEYHVFSSTNVNDWTDEGLILDSDKLTWGYKGGFMWAPDCIEKDGTYYFYYPHPSDQNDWGNSWKIAVATAPAPTGPWTDKGPIAGAGGPGMIDPNVLIDPKDGQAYLFYGGSQKLMGVKLKDNMIELDGTPQELTNGLTGFHEGPWAFERNGIYYMSYAKGRPNAETSPTIGYATSSSPMGPYTFKGEILAANPATPMDTSHGSVVEYQGEWFVFYHNMALSGFECLRSVCVDRLTFNEDGTIQTVIPSPNTPPVPNKTAPVGATEYKINKTDWTLGDDGTGTDRGPAEFEENNGIVNIAQMQRHGAYAEFKKLDGGANGGKATIYFKYSTLNEYAAIRVRIGNKDFQPAAAVPNGAWGDFTNYTQTTVELQPGMNTIRIKGGAGGVNITSFYIKMQ